MKDYGKTEQNPRRVPEDKAVPNGRGPGGFIPQNEIYAGKNPVREALRAGVPIDSVYVSQKDGALAGCIAECEKSGVVVKTVPKVKLDFLAQGAVHQGIVAIASCVKPGSTEDIFFAAGQKNEAPLILIADGVEDPHNLGALIRSAECAGAHGVITGKHRSAVLGGVVNKSSAGAVAHITVVKATNLVQEINRLKERGVWVYGADAGGETYKSCDLTGPSAIVIGAEGKGLGRLVKESCDKIVSIPMRGKTGSLNASVAGGILLFHAAGQRTGV